ncbi:MAG TPA: PQQ-dependent sugar dehydrogenase [Gammaproteobacteria bacterium]|nr:PQQ-dependent sugar dehydrogenase [Gammaproteobacteria bacterium]
MTDRRPSVGFLVLWHTLVAALLFAVADLRVPGPGFWSFRKEELYASLFLLGAYLVVALVSIVAAAIGRPLRFATVAITSFASFGAACFALLLVASNPPYSRALLLSVFVAALVLATASALAARARAISLAVLAAGAAAAIGFDLFKTFGPAKVPPMTASSKAVATALYPVEIETDDDPVPKSVVRGGAIAVLGDRYLLATGDGRLYVFSWPAGGKLEKPRLLPYRVPFNPDDFTQDSHTHWDESYANTDIADDIKGVQVWQFRVADVLVKSNADRVRVFASHHYWKRQDQCFTVRVSTLDADREAFLAGTAKGDWQTLFEATPCLPLTGPDSMHTNNPFGGMEIGGRMAFVDDDTLLLTVGDHDFSGLETTRVLAQDPSSSFGKTILIHLADNSSEVFTSGHRNPQGLFVDRTGVLWETEQGPQGGDELNILRKGQNYGWPVVTYGTDYGSSVWPPNNHQGHHDGYVPPMYAWVPSVGISSLVRLELDAFPFWKDDLLVASLRARSVFRVHLEDQRPVFAEPIEIGDRVRDIVEGPDGQILMWTDTYNLVSLHPASGASGSVLFGTRCGTCHKIYNGVTNAYGPDLYGIVGRKAGSNDSFDGYSPAMKAYGKKWTKEELDHFIENPQAAVPGTLMNAPGVVDAKERAAIVDFLGDTSK